MQNPVTREVPVRSLKSPQITRLLATLPDVQRPSRVSLCRRSVLRRQPPKLVSCLKNVAVSKKSLVELAFLVLVVVLRMWADTYWLFKDSMERLVCMVNDIIAELLDLDMEPMQESLRWTSTHTSEDRVTVKV